MMNCPSCEQPFDTSKTCPICGFDPRKSSWVVITKVYPPNDMIVESLLTSFGIPVKTIRKEISQMPVAIGPLAEVAIAVPEFAVKEAKAFLDEAEFILE